MVLLTVSFLRSDKKNSMSRLDSTSFLDLGSPLGDRGLVLILRDHFVQIQNCICHYYHCRRFRIIMPDHLLLSISQVLSFLSFLNFCKDSSYNFISTDNLSAEIGLYKAISYPLLICCFTSFASPRIPYAKCLAISR